MGQFFWLAASVLLMGAADAEEGVPPAPHDLRCEHLHGHVSIDVQHPTFSWKHRAHAARRGSHQTAWQIVVSEDRSNHIWWDSGKVLSEESYSAQYAGPTLQPMTTYTWKVRWWDHTETASPFSESSKFHVTMDNVDWNSAQWIAAPEAKTAPYLVKQFYLDDKGLGDTNLYISGLGWFDLYVNGQRLTTSDHHALVPGWTNYEKRVYYVHLDVNAIIRGLLKDGNNSIGVMLGNGWRDTSAFGPKDPKNPKDTVERVLRLQLPIQWSDSTWTNISTDDTWQWHDSPILGDSVYNGETYDARQEIEGWSLPNADLTGWKNVSVVDGPSGEMTLQTIATIKETRLVKPINITMHEDNIQVVDFGENLSGRCRINVKAAAGTTITMHHAEVLMHEPYGTSNGLPYFANLRGAKATDTYTAKGDPNGEVYEPRFTYHGFRYVQIENYPRALTEEDIVLVRIHTAVNRSGVFNTSSKIMNAIQSNVWSGQESNIMSVITDCDQRDERLGWMGDAGLSADSFALNFDMTAFFPNMLRNIKDEQPEDGSIPDVVPFYRYGGRPADPSWSAAFPQVAWVLFNTYKDKATVAEYLDALQLYIKEIVGRVPSEGLSKMPGPYGDWCPPPPAKKVSSALTSSFSFINNMKQVSELLSNAGQTEAATQMMKDAENFTSQFNSAFMTSGGHYLNDLQVSYALAMALEAVPATAQQQVSTNFLKSISDAKNHLTTGIIGTKFVLPALSNMKQGETAQEIVELTDYPSWGYMIYNNLEPATTIWELWNAPTSGPGMNSRNHHMFSSVSHWLRTHAVGLVPTEPGLKNITFLPASHLGLSWAQTSISEPHYTSLSWKRHGGVQCGKAPESFSHMKSLLPHHEGLALSCGEKGGLIEKVHFASFGRPTGHCGAFIRNPSCHHGNSTTAVENLCLGKQGCVIPTTADFWGEPCGDTVSQLYVEVVCTQPPQTHAELTVPVGGAGLVYLPSHGVQSPEVWESGQLLWKNGELLQTKIEGIYATEWDAERDSLKVHIGSGYHQFTIKGQAGGYDVCVDAKENSTADIKCSGEMVITAVQRAAFGNVEGTCESYPEVHCSTATAKMRLEEACLSKNACQIKADKNTFGSACSSGIDQRHFHGRVTCSHRHFA